MDGKPHVTLYTKPGCHLCDELKAEMARADCGGLYTYEEVNILSDAELQRRYGAEIPVVLINGTHAFRHRMTALDFRRALLKAAGR